MPLESGLKMTWRKVITTKLGIGVLIYNVYLWSLLRLNETCLLFTITHYFVVVVDELDEEERLTQEGGEQTRKLLFLHQTAWQKPLLRLYGNDICLLDAKYKTTLSLKTFKTRHWYKCFVNVDWQKTYDMLTDK